MILDKQIKIKITKKNIDHYSTNYDSINLKDIILVSASHLQPSSNIKINVSCDICDIHRYIKYQAYNKNINSCKEYPIYTCDKCSHIKLKSYNREHYGVEYYSKTNEYKEKVLTTNKDKYGADHYSKTIEYKERVARTNLEKFGVENPFMDKERIKKIFNDKYGVDHPSQVEEFREKIDKTNLERYGLKSPLGSIPIREKIDRTNDIRYGGHPMKNDEVRYINSIIARDKDCVSYDGDNISTFKCDAGHTFKISSETYHNRIRGYLPLCTICYPIGENVSIKEIELLKFVESIYHDNVIKSYRDGLEIDIYLPDLKIGFEFNGLYWHSSQYKGKNYHIDKTKYFADRGIRIIHIWEDDWSLKSDIIKSQISNWVGESENKIYARKCEIREISDKKQVREFLNENHIQGYTNSVKRIGLFHNNVLVSLMTFDKFEGRKKMGESEWNLNRFCNKINTSVIGGASRLFRYFMNSELPERIVSYADMDWSIGGIYDTLGFSKISESKPDYKYIIDNKRVHKSGYRKSKLNTNLSESKFMESIGVNKIYDCGKIKFEIRQNKKSS